MDRCVCCGDIIPEGTQVCINCLNGCNGCGWESKENCKACRVGNKHKEILEKEAERIKAGG